jgi:DNA-binding SARP family transcriptional activator
MLSDFRLSKELCERTINDDRFRESAWRLLIKLATAVGDRDAAADAYRRCESVLSELGTSPSSKTRACLSH